MSFLSKMNGPKPIGVKPVAKTGAPSPIKPAPLSKPSIKKPMVAPTGLSKPNPLKKETAPVQEIKEEVVDNELNGQEISLDITPEPIIEKEEIVVETEDTKVEVEAEETVEIEEQEEQNDNTEVESTIDNSIDESKEIEKVDDQDKEEDKEEELTPQQRAAKTRKRNAANRNKKEALKQHKEELEKEGIRAVTDLPKVDINKIEDYMYPVILPTVDTWEEEKEEVKEVVSSIEIDPDMNSATGKMVLADLATAYSTMNTRLTHYKTQYENLTGKDGIIECVKAIYGQGKNAEERKFAATEACMNYTKPGEEVAVNLFEYEYMIRERFYFYESIVKELEFKRQLLITFNGMLNIESRI